MFRMYERESPNSYVRCLQGFVRREDPLSNLHAARNPAAAAANQFQNYSLGGAGVAQQLPSMDVDAASIASQLRDYDARRDSEVVDDLVRSFFSFPRSDRFSNQRRS